MEIAMLRFIHITDTHIGPTPDFILYSRKPLEYLNQVIRQINQLPFEIDFVLHTGDCVDDGSEAAYSLLQQALKPLKYPIKCVVGNHDHSLRLQSMMKIASPKQRLDYSFDEKGVRFIVLDTRGPIDPGGHVYPDQIAWLRSLCTADGPPIVIAMHHSPVKLDTPWLDAPPPDWNGRFMFIDNGEEVVDALLPASDRILGIFGGHVHGAYQSHYRGLTFFSGQSTFAGLVSLPSSIKVVPEESQVPMFNIVTIQNNQLIVRPRVI